MGGISIIHEDPSQKTPRRPRWNSMNSSNQDLTMGRARGDSTTSRTSLFSKRRRTISSANEITVVEEPVPLSEYPEGIQQQTQDLTTKSASLPQDIGAAKHKRTIKDIADSSWTQLKQHKIAQNANSVFTEYVLYRILRQRPLPPSKDGRHITLDASRNTPLIDERRGHPYIDNHIRSSRYTIWTFFPAQLWFQFTKLANFYFLITGIIQLIPGLSTTGSFTTIVPLLVFLSFSIFREGYDDFRRYRLDRVENRRPARVLRGFKVGDTQATATGSFEALTQGIWSKVQIGKEKAIASVSTAPYGKEFSTTTTTVNSQELESTHWTTVKWIDLRVGDIIEIQRDDQIPADIVLLSAEGRNGIAYIETMALDGETNLKSRQPPSILAKRCGNLVDISTCRAQFVVEDPNLDLYDFNGQVSVTGQMVPLSLANVVYRGSTLRNTTRIIGMVINTGEECKIRMNANKNPQAKAPAIQSMTNKVVFYLAALVILLAIGCSAGYVIWTRVYENKAWYLADSHIRFADIFIAFAIMYNNLIPLALYVSLEIVKACQFWLLHDIEMYDEASDTPMVSNTQTIFENLGQIKYIFSDKTGTLTENVMRFRKLSVAGNIWTHNTDVEKPSPSTNDMNAQSASRGGKNSTPEIPNLEVPGVPQARLEQAEPTLILPSTSSTTSTRERSTSELLREILSNHDSKYHEEVKIFLLSMALCHTCFPELQNDGKMAYQAASPDEHALVEAAHELGFSLIARDSHWITLRIPALEAGGFCEETWEVLDTIEFSTSRKRMSIIVRFPDGRICLFCKGADSIMLQLMRPSEPMHGNSGSEVGSESHDTSESCYQHLDLFATDGLRTLVYGHRFITEPEYKTWSSKYHAATTSLSNRQAMIEAAAELIERDLTLGGATAIEDKLQQGVPETIEKLQQANIKIWMLTGDKRETAINIAHSAHICKPDSKFIILDNKNPSSIESQISSATAELTTSPASDFVIVIDGQTLVTIESNPILTDSFYALLLASHSAIICRASPSQKASIVHSIRTLQPNQLTLAIGDGGNDIAMITEAHVGIGISGREGLQAARVADYSIAQFRFLQRLLLVHGHWNYIRTAKFILYTFWKEMLFYCIQLLYQRWNGYTGTSLFESDSLTVWNTLFTSLCVIIPGIFEQDLSAETLLERPELYHVGQEGKEFNMRSYAWWMGIAAVEAVICYFMAAGLYGNVLTREDQGLFAFGDLLYSVCVVFINVKLLLTHTTNLTIIPVLSLLITVAGWWAFSFFLSAIYARAPGPYYVRDAFTYHFGKKLLWWAVLVIVVMVVLVLEMGIEVARKRWWGTDVDFWQEAEVELRNRKRKEGKAKRKQGRTERDADV